MNRVIRNRASILLLLAGCASSAFAQSEPGSPALPIQQETSAVVPDQSQSIAHTPRIVLAAESNVPHDSVRENSTVAITRTSDRKGPLGKYGDTFQIVIVNGSDQSVDFRLVSVTASIAGKEYPVLTETRIAELKERERQSAAIWGALAAGFVAAAGSSGTGYSASDAALSQTMVNMAVQGDKARGELNEKTMDELNRHYANSALKDVTIEPFGTTGGFLAFEKLKANQDVDVTVALGGETHTFIFRRKA